MEFSFRGFDTPTSSLNYTYNSDLAMIGMPSLRDGGSGPVNMREEIHRELEKEIIREKILAEELERLRILEDERRRRELIIQHGRTGGFPSSLVLGYGEPFPPENRRVPMPFRERYDDSGRDHRDIGGFESIPFLRRLPPPEFISPGKLSGSKRKAPTTPIKEVFSCVGCRISATSARGLQEHMSGRKHQAKVAARYPTRR
ncbi:hypothetical protein L1987_14327 [Smallanthus sonchifolius]|uniref:Uncharacterized protein n=1 Tax=Smallanthus sonchifolius TaxID=185202 RepID=A0ACB9J4S7_9ASTR|nr:hypothetical protein L1987_14327 [Smallanthus sonchifolius]